MALGTSVSIAIEVVASIVETAVSTNPTLPYMQINDFLFLFSASTLEVLNVKYNS